ncbi:MAG: ribosome biogenesis GTPase Der [Planctomycetota bacterium]
MAVPKVAIVGRPNVGKSSLFNWLIGKRMAIVDPTSGVTRDRLSHLTEIQGKYFELIDTGGMGVEDKDGLTRQIEGQISAAIDEAAIILFVLDAHTGITELDRYVSKRLRNYKKPILCVINKCDSSEYQTQGLADCARFGWPIVLVSTTTNRNREELISSIANLLPAESAEASAEVVMKIAVVGKRNAGKSTFINTLANSERMIVSDVPGTTRDSVDVRFEHHGQAFIAIDTAGVRKMKSLADSIEFYSFARAQRTIRRADVVLLFLDAPTKLGRVEKQLASYIVEFHKPCIFVVNKWDLAEGMTTGEFSEYLDKSLPSMSYAPRAFITAKTGKNVQALVDLAQSLFKQAHERVSTAELNRVVQEAVTQHPPPRRQNRNGRIYYASQVAVAPPTIVLFCNNPSLFSLNYRQYLLNWFRETLSFGEVPIRIEFKKRDSHVPQKESGESVAEQPDEVSSGDILPLDS